MLENGFNLIKSAGSLHVQDIVIETILGGINIVQGALLLKLLFVGLKTISPSIQ